jgi:hypothetical protein
VKEASVFAAIALIRAGIDALLEADLSRLSSTELTAAIRELETERRRCESVDQRVLAEVGERGVAGEYGRTSTVDLLVELLRVSPREARARVNRARDLGPRRAVTGEPLDPTLPLVAQAHRVGAISAEHADVITAAVDAIPSAYAAEFTPTVEQALVEMAQRAEPRQVAKAGHVLLARIDQDGVEPRTEEQQRRREFGIRMNRDGTGTPYGRLTAEACAVWSPVIDSLSAPRPDDEIGEADRRSAWQRRHDALLEAGLRLLRSGTLPDCGGVPVTVMVTLSERQLRERVGYAQTAHGELIDVATLLRLASEAELLSVVLDASGGVLSYGRRRRLASCAQRQALAARDRGCSFPGCMRPPAWCEAHHVIPWQEGGPTDLVNLCLVCSFHHREFERRGWTVRMAGGTPEWIPPPWLDSEQRPRRNTAHHIPDIDLRNAA